MKMSLLDLSWLLLESEAIPVHGGFLYVFSPPAGAKADYADKLFKAMRKRPVGAPFNLRPKFSLTSMPQWEKVDVDLADHVFRERLSAPGTERQLFAAAAAAVNPPVASSAPLWRFNWFDGLQGGRFAFLLTVHHAQWDGMAMFRLMGETLPDSPKVRTVRAPWEGLSTWHRPDVAKEKRPALLAKATKLMAEAVRGIADVSKVFASHGTQMLSSKARPMAFGAPEVRLDRHGLNERTYGMTRLSLARVKALAKANECSVNDILTTAVDAAYQAYLEERGIAPTKPLVALVPVALKVPGAGNQISGFVAKLGKPRSAPLVRLAEIRKSMTAGKADINKMSASGAKLFAMISMGISAGPDMLRIGERMPVTANLIISNPYGLPKPLFLNGSRLDYFMPLVGPSLGTRMTAGFMSYADETFIALISTRSVVPDIDRLARLADRQFRVLERASPKSAPAVPARRAPTKASTSSRVSTARVAA